MSSDSQDMGTAGLTTRQKWPANPSKPPNDGLHGKHASELLHPSVRSSSASLS